MTLRAEAVYDFSAGERTGGAAGEPASSGISSLDELGSWFAYYLALPDGTMNPDGANPLTSWEDQSGNTRTASLIKSGNSPSLATASGINASRWMDCTYDGAYDGLGYKFSAGDITAVNAWTTGTLFVVFRLNTLTTSGLAQHVMSASSSLSSRYMSAVVANSTGALTFYLDRPSGTAGSSITWTPQSGVTALSTDTWYVLTVVHDGTGLKIYVDGVDTGATYSESDSGNNCDETNWIADFDQDIGCFNVGCKLESDADSTGAITFGSDGQYLGWGQMEAALDAAAVGQKNTYLRSLLIG